MQTILITMPEIGVLQIRRPRDSSWVEIRGTYDQDINSPFQQAIDIMPGGHSSVLFAEEPLTILERHVDYPYFSQVLTDD